MNPLDAFWHLANALAPAMGVGLLAPLLAKWVWRNRLRQRPYRVLATWAVSAAVLCSVLNAIVLEGDGRVLGYGYLVLAVAAALWWAGFGFRTRGRR